MSKHKVTVRYCIDDETEAESTEEFELDDNMDEMDRTRMIAAKASNANMKAYGTMFNKLLGS